LKINSKESVNVYLINEVRITQCPALLPIGFSNLFAIVATMVLFLHIINKINDNI